MGDRYSRNPVQSAAAVLHKVLIFSHSVSFSFPFGLLLLVSHLVFEVVFMFQELVVSELEDMNFVVLVTTTPKNALVFSVSKATQVLGMKISDVCQ